MPAAPPAGLSREGFLVEINADKFLIAVNFDPSPTSTNRFSYEIDGGPPQNTFAPTVSQELGLVVLNLHTVGGGSQAQFATGTLEWLSALGDPISTPQDFFVDHRSGEEILIVDVNTVSAKTTFRFKIKVVHEETTFISTDPTIINTPVIGDPDRP
ncbi:MAG TPA: hypothetical protein VMW27_11220 [Thermoanaerobaculia bacterium]|nr:hypothetical protein [Thermoanaerobaculia bacterium]